MKISILLLFVGVFSISATVYSQDAKISIQLQDNSINDVFTAIKEQTDYSFWYDVKDVDVTQHVSLSAENETVKTVLSQTLKDQDVDFTVYGNHIIIAKKGTFDAMASQQTITVTGKVTDESREPLPGVNVSVKGTSTGTTTDLNGRYSIAILSEEAVLVFSYIGFTVQELTVGNRRTMDVTLSEDTREIDEVVVIGYGTVRKSDLTGSVATVSSEKITQVKAISNIAHALQGQAPGVQANQRSGQPGESVMIKIRGTNSISAGNDPLYVVDGLLLDGLSAQLNPDDIQNIEILKDASATAIYGSRGANGVIMITTKRGKEGKAIVSYNGYFGTQQLRKKIDLINAQEYAQLQNEVATNDDTSLPWTSAQISALGAGTDWQDEVYRIGKVQSHDLSLSGGSANTKYYTSFGYFNQEGIIRNSGFDRLSFRVNVDQNVSQKIVVNTSMSIQNSKYVQGIYTGADGGGGIPFTTMVMPPTQGIYDANGEYTRFTGVSWGATNPVGISREIYNPNNALRILGNVGLNWEILNDLKLKLNFGVDNNNSKSDYYAPSIITIGQPNGNASKSYSNSLAFLNENLLSYTKTFADQHIFDVLAGYTYQKNQSENLNSGTAADFISDIYLNNNISAANTKAQPSTGYTDSKLVSYLGRFNYNYDNRYLFTFTGRYDGSSKFGENNKYAFFPSGAVAWRVSQESFMQEQEVVSNLKLRASYGTSGNQAINPYQTLARLNNVNLIFDGQNNTGFVQGSLENKSLKWETTRQFDVGTDFGLFNNRIQIVADYYAKKTTDLLLNVTLPPSSGFGSVLQNVGAVQNRGWEFQANTTNFTGEFTWTSALTISHNRTKILDLGKDASGNPITYKEVGTGGNWFPMLLGRSMSQLYGHTVEGVYQTDQEAVNNGEAYKKAGDYRFRDTDGNGNVDDDDKTVLTNLEPKFTFGFNNYFTYKGFDLSILLVGSYGNDIVNEFRKYNLTMNGLWTPSREAFENRWRGAETGNSVDKPSRNSGTTIRDYANSLWVENGSYLRIRDITLGYSFPSGLLGSHLSSLRIYVSAQNWITLTNYSGYDPEASWSSTVINGWDRGVYPSSKSITGGVRITF